MIGDLGVFRERHVTIIIIYYLKYIMTVYTIGYIGGTNRKKYRNYLILLKF